MKNKIVTLLQDLEQRCQIQVLYAAEAGSRAWGIDSEDSDYDVRFIYKHPSDWYIQIDQPHNVIEYNNGLFDICGWELKKSLQLFRNSNPQLIEWLKSPIRYIDRLALRPDLMRLHKQHFDKRTLAYHYLHMGKNNWKNYLDKDRVWTKKYLYALRAMLACIWIELKDSSPPVSIWDILPILEERHSDYYEAVNSRIVWLIAEKRGGSELSEGNPVPILHDFLHSELERHEKWIEELPKLAKSELTLKLNQLFRGLI